MICICISTGLERDKFDNKTVSFEEHIKFEHNIWHYLYFIVLVREKNKTDYTGPEASGCLHLSTTKSVYNYASVPVVRTDQETDT